jgi:ribosomal protein L22
VQLKEVNTNLRNKMANNTEQPSGKAEQKNTAVVNAPKQDKKVVNKEPVKKPGEKKIDVKDTEKLATKENKVEETPTTEVKSEDKPKTEEKKEEKKPEKKVSKEEVIVNAKSVPVSTKYSIAICRFIKGKEIKDARRYLEDVKDLRKSIPMKGEYGHKKGPGKMASGAGRYPVQASEHFIKLLVTLAGNATNHDILTPVITFAMANKASTPVGRFGRWKRKRTHITIKAREKKVKPTKKSKKENKK